MGLNYHLGTHSATLEFGGEVPQCAQVPECLDAHLRCCQRHPTRQISSRADFKITHYYGGNYHMGPVTDYDRINTYYLANQNLSSLDVMTPTSARTRIISI